MQVTIRKCQLLLIFDSKIGSWFEGAGDVVGYHGVMGMGVSQTMRNHQISRDYIQHIYIIYIYLFIYLFKT